MIVEAKEVQNLQDRLTGMLETQGIVPVQVQGWPAGRIPSSGKVSLFLLRPLTD